MPTLLIALITVASPAPAQSWPQKPVRLIVPLGPGSATDVTARLFADRLRQRWGQAVVVENRAGPDGLVAAMAFVDAHTLMFSIGGPVTINPVSHARLDYDPDRNLVPIASASDSFLAVAVNASLGINSIDALIARARAEPGMLSWAATPGPPQFTFAGFAKAAGLDMAQVSYRDFSPAFQDIVQGRIQVDGDRPLAAPAACENRASEAARRHQPRTLAGGARPSDRARDRASGACSDGFQGFFGWRGMPDDLRERIAADVRAVGADAALGQRLAVLGQAVRTGTPAEFAAMIAEQRGRIAQIAQAIGLQKQ